MRWKPSNSLGELFRSERRQLFHPEIQAEIEFGLDQSKATTANDMLDNLKHFLDQDAAWDGAEKAVISLRAGMTQQTLAATKELADAAPSELSYQYALWNVDYVKALEHCRAIIGKLNHSDLRGYRALWLYFAGSAAWLGHEAGQLDGNEMAKDYFRKAQAAAPVLRWLVGLGPTQALPSTAPPIDPTLMTMIERLEAVLESMGTIHDRKYDAEECAILDRLLQSENGKEFEDGHKRLGNLLGYSAANSSEDAAPDPWWIADDSFCMVFEDHAEGKPETIFSATKARQAASHPEWIRTNLPHLSSAEVVAVVITPCSRTTKGAIPSLKSVRYWLLDDFRAWAKNSLQVLRDVRREFQSTGNLTWRTTVAERFTAANNSPQALKNMLTTSAADRMQVVNARAEDIE